MNASLERLVAYLANRTDRLGAVLEQERAVLTPEPADDARAWGIGFYQGDEVLYKKRPLVHGEVPDVGGDVQTDCALLHLNQRLRASFRTHDVGPFRFRRWSYAQIGADEAEAFPIDSLPDFLGRAVAGTSAAERFFHRILAKLHDASALDHGHATHELVLESIRTTAAEAGRDSTVGPFAAAMTSGDRTFAISCGIPVYHVHRRGLSEARTSLPEPEKGIQLRYAVIVAGVEKPPPSPYEPIAPNSVAIVERDLRYSVHPL